MEENVPGHESTQGKNFCRENSRFTIAGSAEGTTHDEEIGAFNGKWVHHYTRRTVRGSVGLEDI